MNLYNAGDIQYFIQDQQNGQLRGEAIARNRQLNTAGQHRELGADNTTQAVAISFVIAFFFVVVVGSAVYVWDRTRSKPSKKKATAVGPTPEKNDVEEGLSTQGNAASKRDEAVAERDLDWEAPSLGDLVLEEEAPTPEKQ